MSLNNKLCQNENFGKLLWTTRIPTKTKWKVSENQEESLFLAQIRVFVMLSVF